MSVWAVYVGSPVVTFMMSLPSRDRFKLTWSRVVCGALLLVVVYSVLQAALLALFPEPTTPLPTTCAAVLEVCRR